MRTAMVLVLGLALSLVSTGCGTLGKVSLPGGGNMVNFKDVTLEGLSYTVKPDGTCELKVAKYCSAANVAIAQAQAALLQGVVSEAVSAAVKAAVPVAAPAATPLVVGSSPLTFYNAK